LLLKLSYNEKRKKNSRLKTLVKANGAPGTSSRMLGLLRQKRHPKGELLAVSLMSVGILGWNGRRQANEGRHGEPTTRSKAL